MYKQGSKISKARQGISITTSRLPETVRNTASEKSLIHLGGWDTQHDHLTKLKFWKFHQFNITILGNKLWTHDPLGAIFSKNPNHSIILFRLSILIIFHFILHKTVQTMQFIQQQINILLTNISKNIYWALSCIVMNKPALFLSWLEHAG